VQTSNSPKNQLVFIPGGIVSLLYIVNCLHPFLPYYVVSRDLFKNIHALYIIYRIYHELAFKINFYETSLGKIIKRAFGKFYNYSATSFINVYSKMTTWFLVSMEPSLGMLSKGFLHATAPIILY